MIISFNECKTIQAHGLESQLWYTFNLVLKTNYNGTEGHIWAAGQTLMPMIFHFTLNC